MLESALETHSRNFVYIDSPEAMLLELTILLCYDVANNDSVQEQMFLAQLQHLLDDQEYERLPDFFDKAMAAEMPHGALLIGAYKAEARFATLCTQIGVPLNMGLESDALLPLLSDDAGAPQLIEWAKHLAMSYAQLHQCMGNQLLRTINNWLQRNLSSGVTLQAAASQVYMSPNYLSRMFKEATGETFSNYVFRYKMEYAQQMLLNSDANVYREVHANLESNVNLKIKRAKTTDSWAAERSECASMMLRKRYTVWLHWYKPSSARKWMRRRSICSAEGGQIASMRCIGTARDIILLWSGNHVLEDCNTE